jgi:hypothetical protein
MSSVARANASGDFGRQPYTTRRSSLSGSVLVLSLKDRLGLIDEHQALGINSVRSACPLKASARDVGAVAFARRDGFF